MFLMPISLQIQLNPTHTPYQRILYHKRVNEPIQDYELQTVTFGGNCAAYLVIRILPRLAKDIRDIQLHLKF